MNEAILPTQTTQMWHDCDSIFLIQLRVTDLMYKLLYWFWMYAVIPYARYQTGYVFIKQFWVFLRHACVPRITFLGQGCPGTVWDIPIANRSTGEKKETDMITSVQKNLLDPRMFGLWLFREATAVKPIKHLKWFSFCGCSKHWPLSLSVDSYLRLNNAYYHFKKKKRH